MQIWRIISKRSRSTSLSHHNVWQEHFIIQYKEKKEREKKTLQIRSRVGMGLETQLQISQNSNINKLSDFINRSSMLNSQSKYAALMQLCIKQKIWNLKKKLKYPQPVDMFKSDYDAYDSESVHTKFILYEKFLHQFLKFLQPSEGSRPHVRTQCHYTLLPTVFTFI